MKKSGKNSPLFVCFSKYIILGYFGFFAPKNDQKLELKPE